MTAPVAPIPLPREPLDQAVQAGRDAIEHHAGRLGLAGLAFEKVVDQALGAALPIVSYALEREWRTHFEVAEQRHRRELEKIGRELTEARAQLAAGTQQAAEQAQRAARAISRAEGAEGRAAQLAGVLAQIARMGWVGDQPVWSRIARSAAAKV